MTTYQAPKSLGERRQQEVWQALLKSRYGAREWNELFGLAQKKSPRALAKPGATSSSL